MRGLASIADTFGSGTIRLTVWQNLILSDIPAAALDAVKAEIESLGLHWSATNIRGGLVACTGSAGCKYAGADTKRHAMEIAQYVESRLTLDQPVNIHLTGCHHSCAQHYIGDIGLIATKVAQGDDMLEGYHIFVGGGYGATQGIARELWRDVLATDAPAAVERILRAYIDHRNNNETFVDFVKRHDIDQLKTLMEHHVLAA
jgi:ferredoxin-nitrite reductase